MLDPGLKWATLDDSLSNLDVIYLHTYDIDRIVFILRCNIWMGQYCSIIAKIIATVGVTLVFVNSFCMDFHQ